MSKQIGLPVYKATYDLLLFSFKIIKDVEKDYKYTVGEKLKNEITELLMNIYRANKTKDRKLKKEKVEKAQENVEVIRILFRLLNDLKQTGLKNFVKINSHLGVLRHCDSYNLKKKILNQLRPEFWKDFETGEGFIKVVLRK